jgi:hypothetical protein
VHGRTQILKWLKCTACIARNFTHVTARHPLRMQLPQIPARCLGCRVMDARYSYKSKAHSSDEMTLPRDSLIQINRVMWFDKLTRRQHQWRKTHTPAHDLYHYVITKMLLDSTFDIHAILGKFKHAGLKLLSLPMHVVQLTRTIRPVVSVVLPTGVKRPLSTVDKSM